MNDHFDRTIDYLRLSVTDACNYRCTYCKSEKEESLHSEIMSDEEILKIVEAFSQIGVHKVRLTGGEPMLRKGIVPLIRNIKKVAGIQEIAMTTNASHLYPCIASLKEAGLDRINISLDSLDPLKFKMLTRGGNLSEVLMSINQCLNVGLSPVKLNVVLMKGINEDEIETFVYLTKDLNLTVRFIELMPIGSSGFSYKDHFISTDTVLKTCPDLVPIPHNPHDTATLYQLPNALGKVGLISAVSHEFCGECNRVRVTADGFLKTCLLSQEEVDLRHLNQPLIPFIEECILNKPKSHHLHDQTYEPIKRSMSKIGG